MLLPPTYVAQQEQQQQQQRKIQQQKDTTAKDTFAHTHMEQRERRNRESGSNNFDSIEVCASKGGVAGAKGAKRGVTSFCGF